MKQLQIDVLMNPNEDFEQKDRHELGALPEPDAEPEPPPPTEEEKQREAARLAAIKEIQIKAIELPDSLYDRRESGEEKRN